MATLVLTVVGGIVGGPVGAALGGMIGQSVDRDILFRPKGREGPRLADLKLQTSSYGTPIGQVFGRMRIAGSVIWSTDLIEHRSSEGGGKGQPSYTTYSYSASFAVLLSGRPIRRVERVWADGSLLRGAAGDLKVGNQVAAALSKKAIAFRLHPGGEDQAVDPLIASAEGIGLTPAQRGAAYAVFENLPLGDYGNRIPSLTFEVVGDDAPVTAGRIAQVVSGGVVRDAGAGPALTGFSAYGDTGAVIGQLAEAGGARFVATGATIAMRDDPAAVATVRDEGIAARGRGATGVRALAAIETVPRSLAIDHYDPARDYQIGSQRARRPGAGRREERIALPATLSSATARSLAEAALSRAERGRETRTLALGFDAWTVRPGDAVTIAGTGGTWRVTRWSLEAMVLTLECRRLGAAPMPLDGVDGRAATADDAVIGATRQALIALPALDDAPVSGPRLTVAANGTGRGWRRAAMLLSEDGGASYREIGRTGAPAVLGRVIVPPAAASARIVDGMSALEVELLREDMLLFPAEPARLLAGANLAAVGDELLQFGSAEQTGPLRWRLTRLWRGRRGTESAIGTAVAGDPFTLIEPGAVATIALPAAAIGGTVRLLAAGPGDEVPASASATVAGRAGRPLAPVHLRWRASGAGAIVSWIRRSRAGWAWQDRIDAPLGEEREAYRVTIASGGAERTIDATVAAVELSAAERAAGAIVSVRMLGAGGVSPAAAITVPAMEG